MTFEEALEFKKNIDPKNHIDNGILPLILVIPNNSTDFALYKQEFYIDPKTDERAKIFDTHKSFDVAKIYIYDVNVLMFKRLTKK